MMVASPRVGHEKHTREGRDELSLNDKKLYFILMCMCYINDVG